MLRLSNFKGYIFDMDGLLLDTEPTYFAAWARAIEIMGYEFDLDQMPYLSGLHLDQIEQKLLQWFGNEFDLAVFHKLAQESWHDYVERFGIDVKAGVVDLLTCLSLHKLPICLASNSPRTYIEKCLAITGLTHYFANIVSSNDVSSAKPAPDIFLKAATLMQIDITRCVVFEDSHTGIVAAAASGAFTVFVPSFSPPQLATIELSSCLLASLKEICLTSD